MRSAGQWLGSRRALAWTGLYRALIPIQLAVAAATTGWWCIAAETTSPSQPAVATLDSSSSQGRIWVDLTAPVGLVSRSAERTGPAQTSLESARPVSLAAADFDEDGVTDLATGLNGESGGAVRLHHGNKASLYPYSEFARRARREGRFEESPYLSDTSEFASPEVPELLEAGDFDADGHKDLLLGRSGDRRLWLLPGTGKGRFRAAISIDLGGRLTSLAVGDVVRADGLEDIVVGVSDPTGSRLLVFQHDLGALSAEPAAYVVTEAIHEIRIGRLDPFSPVDIVFLSGGRLGLLSGRAGRDDDAWPGIEWYSFDSRAESLAIGDFAGATGMEVAVLLSNGVVEILRRVEADLETVNRLPVPGSSLWEGVRLRRARTSTHLKDDLLFLDPAQSGIRLWVGDKGLSRSLSAGSDGSALLSLSSAGIVNAALPIRANRDALDDLVLLQDGSLLPSLVATQGSGFIVDSSGDDPDADKGDGNCATAGGVCTFRAAIEEANAGPDKNLISFAPNITLIEPAGLPAIMHPVDIEGGANRVEIDAGFGFILRIDGGGSTLSGLILNGALGSTPLLLRNGNGNIVRNCWIGIDRNETDRGNAVGIQMESSGHTIGGTAQEDRNILSGNGGPGVTVFGNTADNNKIQGNYIGTDSTGERAIANGTTSFSTGAGVRISEATNTIVGGTEAGAANLISGNMGPGISDVFGLGTLVQGNSIGVDKDADPANLLPNTVCGIVLAGTSESQLGGTTESAANIIGGNGECGIRVQGISQDNRIWGNHIGTDKDGKDLGNQGDGVEVASNDDQVGGDSPEQGNRIWFNAGAGVVVCRANQGVSILANSIVSQGGLGIDLTEAFSCDGDGVTDNDDDDADTGANQLQNFPELTAAGADTIRGILRGAGGRTLQLRFFSSPTCDPSGHGEGAESIGILECTGQSSTQCSTAGGILTFETPFGAPEDRYITATATEFDGAVAGSTSEFSNCAETEAGRIFMVNSAGDETDADLAQARPFDGTCDTGGPRIDDEPECTLRAALAESNGSALKDTILFTRDLEIKPKQTLEASRPVIIDETGHEVVISGAGGALRGLVVSGGSSTLRGLTIQGFKNTGAGGGVGLSLEEKGGNFVEGNTLVDNGIGISIREGSDGNQIGGANLEDSCVDPCNLVSRNQTGIVVASSRNHVQGNFIGTDRSGLLKRGNMGGGISLKAPTDSEPIVNNLIGGLQEGEGNVISGNGLSGLFLNRRSEETKVQGNLIGVGRDGRVDLGNNFDGIGVDFRTTAMIGGLEPGAGNVIAHNRVGVALFWSLNIQILSNSFFSNKSSISHRELDHSAPQPFLLDPATIQCNEACQAGAAQEGRMTASAVLNNRRLKFPSSPQRFYLQFYAGEECPGLGRHLIETREVLAEIATKETRVFRDLPIPLGGDGFPLVRAGSGLSMTVTHELIGTAPVAGCTVLSEDSDGDGCPDEGEAEGEGADPTKCTADTGLGNEVRAEVDESSADSIAAAILVDSLLGEEKVLPGGFQDWIIRLKELGEALPAGVGPQPQSTTVTLFLPEGVVADTYFNFGPTPENPDPHLYEFLFDGTTGAEIFEDRIVLHYVDGARGDHDLTVNGVIETRGGPATNASPLLFPYNRTVEGSFTGFAVSNFSDRNAVVELDAFDSGGELAPFEGNPAVVGVAASSQLARLGAQIFSAFPSTDAVSWVKAKTDNPQVGSFFQIGGGTRLDGSVAFTEQAKTLYFTRAFEGPAAFRGQPVSTLLSLANPNTDPITVDLTLTGDSQQSSPAQSIQTSEILFQATHEIAGRGALFGTLSEIFEEEVDVASGVIQVDVTEGEGAVGFELIQLQNQDTVIGLNASFGSEQTESFSAQLASVAGAVFTSVKAFNSSQQSRNLTLTAVAEDGGNLVDPVHTTLGPGEFLEQDAGRLFGFETDAVGSLRIAADGPGVIGDVLFGDAAGLNFAASLPLQTQTFTEAVFSQVADIAGVLFTGLAFYNPGNVDANVTIQIISAQGLLVGEAVRVIGAGKRLSELTSQLVPESAGQAGGYVRIGSDQPIIAQVIFGGLGGGGVTLFSAVPPTPIQ